MFKGRMKEELEAGRLTQAVREPAEGAATLS